MDAPQQRPALAWCLRAADGATLWSDWWDEGKEPQRSSVLIQPGFLSARFFLVMPFSLVLPGDSSRGQVSEEEEKEKKEEGKTQLMDGLGNHTSSQDYAWFEIERAVYKTAGLGR